MVIGPDHEVAAFSSITACTDIEVEDDEEPTADVDLGKGSVGKLWVLASEESSTLGMLARAHNITE